MCVSGEIGIVQSWWGGRSGRRSADVGEPLLEGPAGSRGRIQVSAGRWRHGRVGERHTGRHCGGGLGAEGKGSAAVGGEGGRRDLCDRGVGRGGGGAGAGGGSEDCGRGVSPALLAFFWAISSARRAASAGGRGPVAAPAQGGYGHDRLE